MLRSCLLLVTFGACATDPAEPVQYTGETRRFVVDSLAMPMTNTQAREFGLDLNGDRTVDNQLGQVISTLGNFEDVTTHGPDMIAAGAIASSVELVADDFGHDDTVALRYFGQDGEHAELVGGELSDGAFTTTLPGLAIAHLPVFVDADPIIVRLNHVRVTARPDGRGGFDARVGGAIVHDEAIGAAFAGIQQMIAARPTAHISFFRMLDTSPHDFVLTQRELETDELIESLLAPDVTFDGRQMLSIGFAVHLSPCAEGSCVTAPPAAPCFDRVRDGDETDIDCGGSCGACATGAVCGSGTDCQSLTCTSSGTCSAPSCSNGVQDGFETDVDCGGECGACALGGVCWSNDECASGQCGAPCSGSFCGMYTTSTCR